LDTLRDLQQGTREALKNLSWATKDEFAKQELEVARLDTLVGERRDNFGTMPLFEVAELLSDDSEALESIKQAIKTLEDYVSKRGKDWEEKFKLECRASAGGLTSPLLTWETQFMNKLQNELQPLLKLYMVLSSNQTDPGNVLESRLQNMDAEISNVKQRIREQSPGTRRGKPNVSFVQADSSTTANIPGLWGNTRMETQTTGVGSGASGSDTANIIQRLESRLKLLEADRKKMKERLDGGQVDVARTTFNTHKEVKMWLLTNAAAHRMFIHFVNFHALVNVGSAEHATNALVMKFEADAIKAGHRGEEEALVSAIFKIEVPVIFGSDSQNYFGTRDSRVLPGMKTFEEWDSGDGYTGLRYVLAQTAKNAKERLTESANLNLTGNGLLVALDMIATSYQFVIAFLNWLSQEFQDLVGRGGDKDTTWKLLCQSIQKIFTTLHSARQAGRGRMDPGDKPSLMMWGSLQAHRRMQVFIAHQFNGDPDLFYILNKHLQDNVALKKDVTRIEAEVVWAKAEILSTTKTIDMLTTKVNRRSG